MLTLESVLGFCHRIAKGGDCKVEFIQPSNWLYSVPNLLVFQHLVILYLGGLVVRVVSEIEWSLLKNVQENRDSRLGLAGDSQLQAARRSTPAKHARRWTVMLVGALQDKTGQLAIWLSRDWISRLSQVARPSREPALFLKILTFHIPLSLQYIYPLYPQKTESFQREFWERNPRVKQNWFIYNLYISTSSNSSTLFLSIAKILERLFTKTLFSPYPLLWEGYLVF